MARAFLKSRMKEVRDLDLRKAMRQIEMAYVHEALRRTDGNVQQAAKLLGIQRSQLYRIMAR